MKLRPTPAVDEDKIQYSKKNVYLTSEKSNNFFLKWCA